SFLFFSFPLFLLIFFFSPSSSSLNPSQHLAHTTMIGHFSGSEMAPNCCSSFPLLNALIRFPEIFFKSHKNTFNI
ncbi:hypothetical protein ES319_D09G228700v1, partial [Gossypium barbadense]